MARFVNDDDEGWGKRIGKEWKGKERMETEGKGTRGNMKWQEVERNRTNGKRTIGTVENGKIGEATRDERERKRTGRNGKK